MATAGGGATPPLKPDFAADFSLRETAEDVTYTTVSKVPVSVLAARFKRKAFDPKAPSVEDHLFAEPYAYNFFQAVRLLEAVDRSRVPVGRGGPPRNEVVRFRAHVSLSFPPSQVFDLEKPTSAIPVPVMTVAFLGLHGPSGILPRHYTEMLIRLEKESKDANRFALRDWFDLFNHRFISLFYRAWEKYRFFIPYARGEYARSEPDPFTLCLLSFVGLGSPALRNRQRVAYWEQPPDSQGQEHVLARVDDLALLHYSGFLSHRPRCAVALEALLQDYFGLQIQVQQFRGQWLRLEPANQSSLDGLGGSNNQMGLNLVAGERVWDVTSKVRIRLGPLTLKQFHEFLPDRTPLEVRKAFFTLCHLVRFYVGPELDFDVQLVLKKEEVPPLKISRESGQIGPRLGWNTWLTSQTPQRDADEAAFEGEEVFWLNADERMRAVLSDT
jgi:type VI secretion system protein ImpH